MSRHYSTLLLLALLASSTVLAEAPAQTFVVTSGADTDDNTCDATHCTLREAINHANFVAGTDRITFALPGQAGQQVSIVVGADLPGITEAVEIDGFTQPGAVAPGANGTGGTWLVNLVAGTTSVTAGLDVRASGVRISGLAIKGFGFGLLVGYQDPSSTTPVVVNDVIVTQNLIGFGPTTAACGAGTTGNRSAGVFVRYGARRTVVTKNFVGCNFAGVSVAIGAKETTVSENWIGARPGQGGFPVPLGNTRGGVEVMNSGSNRTTITLNLVMNNADGVRISGGDTTDVMHNNFAANTANGVNVAGGSAPIRNVRVRGNGFGLFDALPGFTSSAKAAGRNGRGVLINEVANVVVGGTTAADRNLLAYSIGPGVEITGATAMNNRVTGNYIGTGTTGEGNVNAGNQGGGIVVRSAPDNVIGGAGTGEGNLIVDNEPEFATPNGPRTHGIAIIGASRTLIRGNRIGVSASGANEGQGNHGYGIYLERATDTQIGQVGTDPVSARNLIANNRFGGIQIGANVTESGGVTNGNTVGFNAIYRNGDNSGTGLGIDLGGDGVTPNDANDADNGPNFLTNSPQITGVTLGSGGAVVTGTMPAEPSTSYTIRFFVSDAADPSGYGEGQTPVGVPLTLPVPAGGSSGVITFTSPPLPGVTAGQFVTATATHPGGETGEFGNAFRVRAAGELVVTSADDTNDGACTAVGTGNGCTLREAINEAERNADVNTILFDLPATTPAITLSSPMTTLSRSVVIDGFSQPSAVRPDASGRGGRPVVAVIGGALPAGSHGFTIRGSGISILGLRLLRFSGAAVEMAGPGSNGNLIAGNYIGTTPTSTDCAEGHGNGVGVQISIGATGNYVGVLPLFGATPMPNVIGCNTTGVVIDGAPSNGVAFNVIGTGAGAGGTLLNLANDNGVIVRGTASAGNLVLANDLRSKLAGVQVLGGASGTGVAGNSFAERGISLNNAPGTTITGNGIGRARFPLSRTATGYVDVPVAFNGISVQGSPNVVIGGTDADTRNVIAGVEGDGIRVTDFAGSPQSAGLRIIGNYIGANETGNAGPGVILNGIAAGGTTGIQIGGAQPGEGNVIVKAGQGRTTGFDLLQSTGILLQGAHNAVVEGNLIGVGVDGAALGGKNSGILVVSTTGARIGGTADAPLGRNVIFHNGGAGIQIGLTPSESVTRGITVGLNWIDNNGGLGIDLGGDGTTPNDAGDRDTGPNGLTNAPVIQYAYAVNDGIRVSGTYDGRPAADGATQGRRYTFQAFIAGDADAQGNREGLLPIGTPFTATADRRTGRITFASSPLGGLTADAQIVLLATDDEGNTSEFSAARRVGTETARIRATHGIAGASRINIDVALVPEGRPTSEQFYIARNISYKTESASFAEVNGGRYSILAYIAGTTSISYSTITHPPIVVQAGEMRLVFVGDPEGPTPPGSDSPIFVAPKYVALAPRGVAHQDGQAAGVEVFVVHGVPDGPPLTVVVKETGQVLAQNLALGQASDLVTVETGTATLEVRRASDGAVLRAGLFNFTAAAGEVIPVLVSGFLTPPPGRNVPSVEVTPVTDNRSVAAEESLRPFTTLVLGAAPNPTRGTSLVRYGLPETARVRLAVYDALGREVTLLVDGNQPAGLHAAPLDTRSLSPGVYLLRLTAGADVRTVPITVIR